MDSFAFDDVKAEKASAMRKYNVLRSFAKLFRFIEICVALVFLSWISSRLPLALRISGEFFRRLLGFILSPLFGFLLCNAIIVTLLAKPGKFSGICEAESEIYEGMIKSSGDRPNTLSDDNSVCSEAEEIVYQDKEIVSEVNTTTQIAEVDSDSNSDSGLDNPKVYKRSQSEKIFKRECTEKIREKLRRSETEKMSKIERFCENSEGSLYYGDDLSSEEFQRRIEEFIAKELKFRREESLAIVLHSQS